MPPSDLGSLFESFLERQISNPPVAADGGDAFPYQSGTVHPLDPRLCWRSALLPVELISGYALNVAPPPGWAALVDELEPVGALACAAGNFPQLVRPVASLFRIEAAEALHSGNRLPLTSGALSTWAESGARSSDYPEVLLALGVLRAAWDCEKARSLLSAATAGLPIQWHPALANEEAALAWQQGRAEEARDMWMAQEPSTPVLFNRGMASLFLKHPAEARVALNSAITQLPENDSWHHLARLYVALAESAA